MRLLTPRGLPTGVLDWRALLARATPGPVTAAPTWPRVGPVVPTASLSVAAGLVAGLLVHGAFPESWQLAVVVGALVAVRPSPAVVVALVLVLAGHQVLQPLVPVRLRYSGLLAGVHLLHVLTALAGALPRRGWVQLAALRRPLGRFAAVQAGAQLVALLLVAVVPGPDGGLLGVSAPVLGAVGAAALLVAALALLRPLLRRPPR